MFLIWIVSISFFFTVILICCYLIIDFTILKRIIDFLISKFLIFLIEFKAVTLLLLLAEDLILMNLIYKFFLNVIKKVRINKNSESDIYMWC